MKEYDNLDTLLRGHPVQPKRALTGIFTETVAARIKDNDTSLHSHAKRYRLLGNLSSKYFSKVGASLALMLVLTTATTAALTMLNKPTTTKTLTKTLPSGNHILGVDARNCDYFSTKNGSPISPETDHIYYEVRQGTTLTDDQIKQGIQGLCEQNIAYSVANAANNEYHFGGDKVSDSTIMTVEAVDANSITLRQDSHYSLETKTAPGAITYTHLAPNLVVRDGYNASKLGDIHAGDSVILWAHDDKMSEQDFANGQWKPWSNPNTITVLSIIKTLPLTADPGIAYKAFATDIVRLNPCTTSPTGFCRAYDFVQ